MTEFIEDKDPFTVKRGKSLRFLSSRISKYEDDDSKPELNAFGETAEQELARVRQGQKEYVEFLKRKEEFTKKKSEEDAKRTQGVASQSQIQF